MTSQPKDIAHYSYDHDFFESLDDEISFLDDSQATNNKADADPNESSMAQVDKSLEMTVVNEFIQDDLDTYATPILAPFYAHQEPSSSQLQFDESEIWNSAGPINEVTITTTPSDTEDENNNVTASEMMIESNPNTSYNWTADEWEKRLKEFCDQIKLQNIDNSIQQRTISIETEPPENLRPRYKTDGKRQIEKSRTKPMTVKLPNLKNIQLDPAQSFLLRLALTTHSQNPSDSVYLHMNKLEYHSADVEELPDGTVAVLISENNINEGKLILPRLSIVKTKLEVYNAQLTPYSLTGTINQLHENSNNNEKMPVNQAKIIFKQYNLKASRISCQLLIKENQSIHYTNIICQTHVIEQSNDRTNKRKANAMDSDEDERPHRSKSKRSKRKKRSY